MAGNRVAVTGMGMINGLGHNLETVWTNLLAGKSGITTIENHDMEKFPVKIGGEVKNFSITEDLLEAKEAPRYDRFIHYALHSSKEALVQAGLYNNLDGYDPAMMGTILGVGMGGFPIIEGSYRDLLEKGPRRVSPFFIPAIIPNMAPGLVSIRFNLQGVNYSISSACASASHAISAAAFEIMTGRQDVMITGGSESALTDLPFAGFINMKALSKNDGDPSTVSRPFDIGRDGFVMGEGAGVMVLENLEKAKARGATIYAELVGHGASSDAHHITAPHPEGLGAKACMNMALKSGGVSAQQVGYVNAHGTSTPLGDIAETKAIKETFGAHATKDLLVSSTKSMTGHLLGAAGGIESIVCAMVVNQGMIPPTINLQNQDPQCDLDYVANKARKVDVEYALNNSFGFGGTNSSMIVKKYS